MTTVLPEIEQLRQAGQAAPALKEIVPNELRRAGSRLNIYAETDGKESLQLLGQLVGLLQAWRAVGGNEIQSLQGLLVQVWRLGFDHLNSHDAQRPDVNLIAILFLLHDLWRHPVWCSHHGGTLAALLGKLGAKSEIGCSWLAHHHAFQIVVN